jgi:hypothetical protein
VYNLAVLLEESWYSFEKSYTSHALDKLIHYHLSMMCEEEQVAFINDVMKLLTPLIVPGLYEVKIVFFSISVQRKRWFDYNS